MATPSPQQVTQLLEAWGHGDQKALDQLIPVVYEELHRLAHRFVSLERLRQTAADDRTGQRSLPPTDSYPAHFPRRKI